MLVNFNYKNSGFRCILAGFKRKDKPSILLRGTWLKWLPMSTVFICSSPQIWAILTRLLKTLGILILFDMKTGIFKRITDTRPAWGSSILKRHKNLVPCYLLTSSLLSKSITSSLHKSTAIDWAQAGLWTSQKLQTIPVSALLGRGEEGAARPERS